MTAWYAVEFWLLALVSTWMTASAIVALGSVSQRKEDMENLYEQVLGAMRAGDLPRAILILEGEPGPLARLLSALLNESTKFSPKLRVAYKVTLESIKRHGQAALNPLRLAGLTAFVIGVVGLAGPIGALIAGNTPPWWLAVSVLTLSLVIGAVASFLRITAMRADSNTLLIAEDLGRKLLNYLLGPESPLASVTSRNFPEE